MKTTGFLPLAARLLEGSQEQLHAFELELDLPVSLELYRQALLASLGGQAAALEALLCVIREDESVWRADFPCLETLVRMRLDFLRGRLGETLGNFTAPQAENLWQGEFLMLCAAARERQEKFAEAIGDYKAAAKSFLRFGVKGKSLRARFNAITLTSHVDPSKNLVREYFFLYREARKLRQFTVMASASLNISREYQRLGAFKLALKFANQSIACGSPDLGGQVYFLAVAHRAHVLYDLGRGAEARLDLEEAQTAQFAEVKAACAVLAGMLHGRKESGEENAALIRTWRERRASARVGEAALPKFSASEEKLLALVASRPRNKFDLIDHLFGARVGPLVAENRLKNILFRIRKKAPGLLVFENEEYRLAESDLPRVRKSG